MSDGPDIAARLRDEAQGGRLPMLPGERTYGTVGMLATGFSYAVAAWCFLIGGYAANVVGAAQGAVALLAGCVLGVALSAAAAALACNRYGLEQLDYAKTCFGQRGARLVLVFYVVNQIGWTGMILVMFGRGVADVATALGAPFGPALVRPTVIVGAIAAYAIVVRGVRLLDVFNRIVTPGLLLVTGLLFFVILRDGGGAALLARPPLAPAADARLGYVVAFEYGLGAGFSWWPGIGFLARHADSQRNSFYPQVLTLGVGMGVVSCAGLFAALRFGSALHPTRWMVSAGGPALGLAALVLIGSSPTSRRRRSRCRPPPSPAATCGRCARCRSARWRPAPSSRWSSTLAPRSGSTRRVGLSRLQRDHLRADLGRAARRLLPAAPRAARSRAGLRGRSRRRLLVHPRVERAGAAVRARRPARLRVAPRSGQPDGARPGAVPDGVRPRRRHSDGALLRARAGVAGAAWPGRVRRRGAAAVAGADI